MKKHILLVGDRGVGKSTLVAKLILTSMKPIYGFCTRAKETDENGLREIYMYPACGTEKLMDSQINLVGITNGKERTVYPEVFNNYGVKLLNATEEGVIVMDELGFMEENASDFTARVLELFDGDIPILATTKSTHCKSEFLDKIKSHPNAEVLELTEENRDDIYYQISCLYEKNS